MKYSIAFALLLLQVVTVASFCCTKKISVRPEQLSTTVSTDSSFYQFTVHSLGGLPVPLEHYRGKKIIVLNVASKCGYTPQYADWERFYSKYKDKVVVLGFPCNDFANQEPGTPEEIAAFCEDNYHVTFPMFEKVHVKGKEQDPLYKWLTDPAQNGWNDQEPTWNFCKYLVNEKGELTHFFATGVTPDDPEFQAAIGL
ncbi:MAG: glutathione peroxidase [Bacteroidetes bacterium]|nr:MAG: glutathione peroxidase [Bacteroidota bacterium]